MAVTVPPLGRKVPCEKCPLRTYPVLRDFTAEELEFVSTFKSGLCTSSHSRFGH